jgi:hypothetical protein
VRIFTPEGASTRRFSLQEQAADLCLLELGTRSGALLSEWAPQMVGKVVRTRIRDDHDPRLSAIRNIRFG